MLEFLIEQFWFGQAAEMQHLIYFLDLLSFKVACLISPVVSQGLPAKSMLQIFLILKYGKKYSLDDDDNGEFKIFQFETMGLHCISFHSGRLLHFQCMCPCLKIITFIYWFNC